MNDEQGRATQVDHARLQALYAESDVTSSDALSVWIASAYRSVSVKRCTAVTYAVHDVRDDYSVRRAAGQRTRSDTVRRLLHVAGSALAFSRKRFFAFFSDQQE